MRNLFCLLLAASYAFAADTTPHVAVHGHRGARALRPENTIPAFEYAIAAGVDALELDMAVTKDNVLVVSHDPFLEAPVCSGGPKPKAAIHQLTFEETQHWDCGAMQNSNFPRQQTQPGTRMPTLDEVFSLAPRGHFLFNIETKSSPDHPELAPPPDEFARLVLAAIKKHHLEQRVVVQSFDWRTLHAMKKLDPTILLSGLYAGKPRSFVEIGRESGAAIISPEYHLVTREEVQAAHAAGFTVLPWTPNETADWKRLVDAGVDGIITDDPAALITFLKSQPRNSTARR
jgi:glycerophosphoryl diester phosphodiesterase